MISAFNNVIIFLIEFSFSTFVYALFLRFSLQCVKADFYNPFCQMIIYITNPLLKPLRRIFPGLFGIDIAALFLSYCVTLFQVILVKMIFSITNNWNWYLILFYVLVKLTLIVLNLYIWLIIIRSITSWFTQVSSYYSNNMLILQQLTEPLLHRIRILIPISKFGLDLSPIITLLILFCCQIFITSISNF